MPELPEVETVVRDLRPHVVGRRFQRVKVRLPKMVRPSVRTFQNTLQRKTITALRRRGKVIIIELGNDWRLLVHLKMTGQLIWEKGKASIAGGHTFWSSAEKLPNKFTHIIFYLSDGGVLYFNDLRQFGWAHLFKSPEADAALAAFGHGPEPLGRGFTLDYFRQILKRYPKRPIKQLLLDQSLIAGIGNIYADETLFSAKIRPARKSGLVTAVEAALLFRSIRNILAHAIRAKGTTIRNYRRGRGARGGFERHLKVFRRDGQECLRCGGTIRKIRLGGRGTHFCPYCQR